MKNKVKLGSFAGFFLATLLVLPYILPSANAISSWYVVSNPNENTNIPFESISAISRDNVWAVGWLGTIIHWDGTLWQVVPCPVKSYLFSIHMISQTDGWIVGEAGTILRWNGATWNVVTSPTRNDLKSVSMVNSNDGWAVGREGTIIRWDGSTWTEWVHSAGMVWNSVFMLSSTNGWLVGDWGNILHWTGRFWESVSFPSSLGLHSIFMLSSDDGWAVGSGGTTQKYTVIHWDGSQWTFLDTPSISVGSVLYSIFMLNDDDGWAAGYNVMLHWDGSTWSKVSLPVPDATLLSIVMVSSGEGWAMGSGLEQTNPITFESRTKILYYGEKAPSPPSPPQFDVGGGTWLSAFKNIYVKTGSSQNIALFEDCAATKPVAETYQTVQQGSSYEFAVYVLNTGTSPMYITYSPTDILTDSGQTRFHISVNVIEYGMPCEMLANYLQLPPGVDYLPFPLQEKNVANPTAGFPLNPNKMIKLDITIRVDSLDLNNQPELGWKIPFEVVSVSV